MLDKPGSRLIHYWRGGCLGFVYLKSIYVVLGCFVLSMGVSPTYMPCGRRLFGVLHFSFSRHTAPASTVRYPSLLVQSTHRAGVDCSVFSALRSADTSHFRRLFGNIRSSFSRQPPAINVYSQPSSSSIVTFCPQLVNQSQYLHGDDRGHGDEGDHAEAAGDEVVSGRCVGGALDE